MLNSYYIQQSTLLPQISVYVLATLTVILLLYYLFVFFKLVNHKAKHPPILNTPVSIVVYAKNDAISLQETLPAFLNQDYEKFEVVVVDDHSFDDTATVIEYFQKKYSNLKFVDMSTSVTNIKGKKYPLSIGIKVAAHEHMLFTYADCMPSSNQWLKHMASRFSTKRNIVLGYGTYAYEKGFKNAFLHYDTFHEAVQYLSFAIAKHPILGNGQNIAYTKSLFMKNHGFSSHYHMTYGEDDLFINSVASKSNCAVEYSAEAQTFSTAVFSMKFWFWQKKVHYKTRHYYKKGDRFLLDLYGCTAPLFYLSLAFAILTTYSNLMWLLITLGIFLVKTVMMHITLALSAKKLNEKRLVPFILCWDIIFSFLNFFLYIGAKLSKNK